MRNEMLDCLLVVSTLLVVQATTFFDAVETFFVQIVTGGITCELLCSMLVFVFLFVR